MEKKNNTTLIAIIAALGTLVAVMFIAVILIFADVIPIGSSDVDSNAVQTEVTQSGKKDEAVQTGNTTASVPTTMYVANVKYSIYLRSEPAENPSNIITEIPVGTQIVWLENTDTVFSKVTYNGTAGYVKRDYLSATKPQVNTAPVGNTTIYKYMYVDNVKNSIYLRSAAVENPNNIITTIPVGTQVGFIEYANGTFSKISYNGTIGYAKSIYLSDYYSCRSTYMTVYNVKHSIYLRSAPKENPDNIICEIPLGTRVRYLGNASGGFYKIEYDGYIGYSKSIYLR